MTPTFVIRLAHGRYVQEVTADVVKTVRHAARARWFTSIAEAKDALDCGTVVTLTIVEEDAR